jgi:hypothetical protein
LKIIILEESKYSLEVGTWIVWKGANGDHALFNVWHSPRILPSTWTHPTSDNDNRKMPTRASSNIGLPLLYLLKKATMTWWHSSESQAHYKTLQSYTAYKVDDNIKDGHSIKLYRMLNNNLATSRTLKHHHQCWQLSRG